MERERYLRLLPAYVRRFVEKSAALLGLDVQGDLDGWFSLVPKRPGALDPLLPALDGYPVELWARLSVRRARSDAEDGIWLHPGEPAFDALREHVLRTFAPDALRGGIFIAPHAKEPYLVHLALASVQLESRGNGDVRPSDSPVLERRLLAVRQEADGPPTASDVDQLLLFQSAGHVPPGSVPLAARGIGMRAAAANHLEQLTRECLVGDRRKALEGELPERRRRVRAGFDLRAADLASRRIQLAAKDGAADEVATVKLAQRDLVAEKTEALAEPDAAPSQIAAGEVQFVVHALVVPANSSDEIDQYDERVEQVAVRTAVAWEEERGAVVQDVSKPALARAAGLPDSPGFDLLDRRAHV